MHPQLSGGAAKEHCREDCGDEQGAQTPGQVAVDGRIETCGDAGCEAEDEDHHDLDEGQPLTAQLQRPVWQSPNGAVPLDRPAG